MKKIITILAVAFIGIVSASNANAIEDQWSKGTMVAGVTAGLDPWTVGGIGLGGIAFGDYVLVDSWWKGHFTVGGQLGYEGYRYADVDGRHWQSHFSVAPRVTYGLNITNQFEVHAGIASGLAFGGGIHPYHSEFVGLHYFFSNALALTAQVGYAWYSPSVLAGISIKL